MDWTKADLNLISLEVKEVTPTVGEKYLAVVVTMRAKFPTGGILEFELTEDVEFLEASAGR